MREQVRTREGVKHHGCNSSISLIYIADLAIFEFDLLTIGLWRSLRAGR